MYIHVPYCTIIYRTNSYYIILSYIIHMMEHWNQEWPRRGNKVSPPGPARNDVRIDAHTSKAAPETWGYNKASPPLHASLLETAT